MSDKPKLTLDALRAHQVYTQASGRKVPGCSTIAKIGESSGALIHWAWQCGRDGIDYRKARDKAADAGTVAHAMIEAYLRDMELDTGDFGVNVITKAEAAFLKFLDWWGNDKRVIVTELQLVSERWPYGGTLDLLATQGNDTLLCDFKTGKAVYASAWRQLAGLGELVREHEIAEPTKFVVVRVGATDDAADFEVLERRSLDKERASFVAAMQLYHAMKAERQEPQ